MDRSYLQWYSPALQKNMEMLVFGYGGASVLFFPARMGRFYDYEEWRIIDAIKYKIENGYLQVYCVDSIDRESFYNTNNSSAHKIQRHKQYEAYIMQEVLPLINKKDPQSYIRAAGCSLGAYHAVNIALKHPGVFNKVVAMSGRYDLTKSTGHYNDLLSGYWDEDVYFNMPLQYVANLTDDNTLDKLKDMPVVLAVGSEDILLESNRQLYQQLIERGLESHLYLWDYEAHKARAWRKMVDVYL